MGRKKSDVVNLTDEQIAYSDEYIKFRNNEKDEIRIQKWVNGVLESDAKTYFSDEATTKNVVATLAMLSFDEYLKDQRDTTEKLLEAADTYAKNKYGAKLQKVDAENLIANLQPYDFKYINDVNNARTLFEENDKNTVMRITPNKRNAWILQCYKTLFSVAPDYNSLSLSSCISSVLTWYASFPGYKREQILYAEVYKEIKEILADRKNKGRYYDFCMESGNIITAMPYKLVTHKEGIHNYLIGAGSPEHYAPVSLRLDRITKVIPNYTLHTRGDLTAGEADVLNLMIKYGPEFTYPSFTKPVTIIRFSKQAQQTYSRVYIHRPVEVSKAVNEDGTADYTFDCTEKQLLTYFRKFDAPYTILQSDQLKDMLIAFYTEALNMLQ